MSADKRLSWIVPCLLLWSGLIGLSNANNATLKEKVYEYMERTFPLLCPYEPLCYRNAAKTPSGNMGSCCRPCSCRDHCHILGNCCPDKRPPMTGDNTEATLSADMFQCICRTTFCSPGTTRFSMVVKCPAKSSAPLSIKEKCEDPPVSSDINAAVPITNPGTGIIYRNSYCAGCHNATGIPWTISLEAFHSLQVGTIIAVTSVSEALFITNVVVSPPPSTNPKVDRCFRTASSTCNRTGNWKPGVDEAPLIEEACSTFTVTHGMSTRNIYCLLCQGIEVTGNETCEITDDLEGLSDRSKFTVILKYSADSTDQTQAESSIDDGGCPAKTIMDIYTNSCRPLLCPQFKELVQGRCVSFVENYSNIFVLMVLELMTDDFQSFQKESKRSKLTAAGRYMNFLTDDRDDVGFTLRDVAETPEGFPNTPYLAVVATIVTAKVPEPNILQWLYDRLALSFAYRAPTGRSFIFSGSISARIHVGYLNRKLNIFSNKDAPTLTDVPANSTLKSIYHKTVPPKTFVPYGELFTDLLFCPQVKLNESEYDDFGNFIVVRATNTTLYSLQYAQSQMGKDVIVCVDDYLPNPSPQSGQGELASSTFQLEIIILLAVVAFLVLGSGVVILVVYSLRRQTQSPRNT